jgi:hypothetical protein
MAQGFRTSNCSNGKKTYFTYRIQPDKTFNQSIDANEEKRSTINKFFGCFCNKSYSANKN